MLDENKIVLVTGAAGFIGSNLVAKLVARGTRVRAVWHVRRPRVLHDGVEYVQADLLEASECARVCQGVDHVYLCAAVTAGAAVIASAPLSHLTPNVIMNVRMLEAAYAAGVKKLLFISSNIVYPVADFHVKETDCTNEFFEKYFIASWMKRFSELCCEMYGNKISRPMETVVVRPANAYGPGDKFDWESSHVLPSLIRRIVERHQPLKIWGDGLDIKDFIYIDDLVEGMIAAMEKLRGFDTVNLASGKEYRIRDLLALLLELDGYSSARVEFDTTKPTMIPKRLIDPSKAARLMGFEARTPIEVGLKRTLDWYRSIQS